MSEWKPEEVTAHLDYYGGLHDELVASGELVDSTILTGPDLAKIVTSDGDGAGRHRRAVPGVQGVAGRLPDRRRGLARSARSRSPRGSRPCPGRAACPRSSRSTSGR